MTASRPEPRGDWFLVAALVAAAILSYVNRQAPTLLVDPLRRDLGLSDVQVSLLIGASFAVIYALCSLAFGWLSDRTSRTRIIAAAILAWSAGSIGCGFAQSFWQLFGCRMVIGASEAALIPSALSLIGNAFPERRRGLATGIFLVGVFGGAGGSIMAVGYLLGLAGQGWLALLPFADVPWRQVFVLTALPGLLLVPFFILRRDERDNARARHSDGAPRRAGPAVAWTPVFLLCAAMTLLAISDNALLAWGPTLLIRDYGMPAGTVGRYLGLSLMLGGGAGVIAGGLLSDRLATRRDGRVLVCAVGAALAVPLPLVMTGSAAMPVIASIGLYLAISAAATCAGTAALLAITAPERRGLVTSILTLCGVALGFGIGPSLTAAAAGWLGGLAPGLIAVSVTALSGASLVFLVEIVRQRSRLLHRPIDRE